LRLEVNETDEGKTRMGVPHTGDGLSMSERGWWRRAVSGCNYVSGTLLPTPLHVGFLSPSPLTF
jgi:hypothetical protein